VQLERPVAKDEDSQHPQGGRKTTDILDSAATSAPVSSPGPPACAPLTPSPCPSPSSSFRRRRSVCSKCRVAQRSLRESGTGPNRLPPPYSHLANENCIRVAEISSMLPATSGPPSICCFGSFIMQKKGGHVAELQQSKIRRLPSSRCIDKVRLLSSLLLYYFHCIFHC
jgi:hypothetical protein